ncbi:MAG: NAD(P)-dependent oxidoreductase [Sulfobacillus benefaciens]|uniref:NAD(P)-dependent oxidoreductase n=1 Tax=Sulfobacillus benefaciens TaxID=453960 RepID=A0A2T2XEU8_9FIRM|nr:MAG: NAD(P)-dependent oxidoreductase [Sulfobacillus benefaciens]
MSHILITGGSRGIGLATAEAFLTLGHQVTIWALHPESVDRGLAQLAAYQDLAKGLAIDVGDYQAVATAAEELASENPVDVLVNNAGWTLTQPFLSESPTYWERIMATNFWGPVYLCHALLPHMVKRGSGAIINVVSDAARVGMGGESIYAAAKGGIISLTKSLAQEMARHKIRVNAVSPGPIATAMLDENAATENARHLIEKMVQKVPLRRLGQPEEVAAVVVFLASDAAQYITGQVLSVSGGLTMV